MYRKNVIHYDIDSNEMFSLKLLHILYNSGINNYKYKNLHTIFVPRSDIFIQKIASLIGIDIITIEGLQENNIFTNYYLNDKKCILPQKTKNLVIALFDDNKPVLGAY